LTSRRNHLLTQPLRRSGQKGKTPRQTSAGFFEFFPGCLAVFSVEQVAFKSPRMVGVKSKTKNPALNHAQGPELRRIDLAHI
jgi:hypothetical protein